MIINDLVQPVIGKLRQRTDVASNVPYWVAMALIDLSMNYEFEELKITGPLTNFISNPPTAEYSLNNNPFVAAPEHRITFIRSFFCYFQASGTITVGQTNGFELNARDFRVVNPMSKILGVPSVYCLFGDKRFDGKLIVGQMPDNPYPCQLRYQREHPFALSYEKVLQSYNSPQNNALIGSSEVYMPYDWTEIIVLAAAEKACDDLGMNEIGQTYHNKLYGYKDKRGTEYPGIITVRMTQQDRQTTYNSRQMRVVVKRYT